MLLFLWPWYGRDSEDGCAFMQLRSDGEPFAFIEAPLRAEGADIATGTVVPWGVRHIGHLSGEMWAGDGGMQSSG